MPNKILFSPKEGTSGFWGLRDVPEPNWNLTSLSNDVKKGKYREALESCKSNSLEIFNPETIFNGTHIDSEIERWYKPGDIFDLPEGYEFKEEEKSDGWMSLTKVLRLVKTETKAVREDGYYWIRPEGGFWIIGHWYQKSKAFTFLDGKKLMSWSDHSLEVNENRIYRVPQPEPEESQESIWDEAFEKYNQDKNFTSDGIEVYTPLEFLAWLKQSNFTIQRKKQ